MKTLFCFVVFWLFSISTYADNGVENPGNEPKSTYWSSILGQWENILSTSELPEANREENAGPSQIETASLRIHFLEDGTFIRTLTMGEKLFEERGRWEITPDEKIVFFFSTGHPVEEALVRYLEPEEMVLELSLHIPGLNVDLEPRQVYFHKV